VDGCGFCRIVAGTAPASVAYRDDATIVFVDPRQPTWPEGGHLLVVPLRHVETVDRLDDELAGELMRTVVRTARAMHAALDPPGLSVWQSNGAGAHQEVPHVHVHVIARYPDDGLLRIYPSRVERADRVDMDAFARRLAPHFA
jgi:histidine triad (HIT) family protein